MESARVYGLKVRQKVVLDRRFKFFEKLSVGDKGSLNAVIELDSVDKDSDLDGNEVVVGVFEIVSAEIIDSRGRRVDGKENKTKV